MFSVTLPRHLAQIETLITSFTRTTGYVLPGELWLFSVIHQLQLIKDLKLATNMEAWYANILNNASTQKVLKGESKMGPLSQYFHSADSEYA